MFGASLPKKDALFIATRYWLLYAFSHALPGRGGRCSVTLADSIRARIEGLDATSLAFSKFRLDREMLDLSSITVVDNLMLSSLAAFGITFRKFLTVVESRASRPEFDSPECGAAASDSSSLSRTPARPTLPQTETTQPATADPQ